MAKDKCICKYCKNEIDKENAYSVIKGQYYCSENHYLSYLEKKKNSKNHSYKSAKGTDRRNFTDKIQDLFVYKYGWNKKKINWQALMAQCKTILDNNPNWTYDTLLYIIWYMQDILGLNLICKESHFSPFSLIEFYALEAEQYWNECEQIQKSVENYDFDECNIVVKSSKNKKIKYKPIDMNNL